MVEVEREEGKGKIDDPSLGILCQGTANVW